MSYAYDSGDDALSSSGYMTPDIEKLAKGAQSTLDAYPTPEKVSAVTKSEADINRQKSAEMDPLRDREIAGIGSDLANARAKYRDIQPVNTQPWKPEEHPISNPLEAFGSNAGVFAMLASALTRQPMENTLNAGAAAINSVRNSDLAGYERARTAWKENFDQAIKVHQAQHEDYQDSIKNMEAGVAGSEAQLKAVAQKYGDKVVQAYLDAGMSDKALEIIGKRAELQQKMIDLQPRLQKADEESIKRILFQSDVSHDNAIRQANGQPLLGPQELVQKYQQFQASDPQKIQGMKFAQMAVEEAKQKAQASGQPEPSAEEQAAIYGNTLRQATQSFGAFSSSKQQEMAVEQRAAQIAKETGKPIWEARLQAQQEAKDAIANPATRERMGSISAAKQKWLDDHPEANGVIPPEVENSIRAKANAHALASAEPNLSDAASMKLAERIVAGDKAAMAGLGYGSVGAANRAKVMEDVTKVADAKGMDGAALARQSLAYSATGAGARSMAQQEARVTSAISKAEATAPRVLEISDKIDRTRFPTVNSLILAAQKGTGGENVVRYGIAVETLINNYALALGGGNASMTDSSKQHARELLEREYSRGQIHAAVDQMMIEMYSERQGLQQGLGRYLNPAPKDGFSIRPMARPTGGQ